MSVQVIMKDGRPEWAVIPFERYEALLEAAGESSAPEPVAATPEPTNKALPVSQTPSGVFSHAKLALLREGCSKSELQLAKDAGISPVYLAQILAGERQPSPAIIRGLAQALGLKADELLG